jgi:VanZ family protein
MPTRNGSLASCPPGAKNPAYLAMGVATSFVPIAAGLLICAVVAIIYYFARRGSSRTQGGRQPTDPLTYAWPDRRHYFWLALFFFAIAFWGSVVPFHIQRLSFSEAVEKFAAILRGPVELGSRSDFVANLLLFVPIGYCFLAAVTADRRSRIWAVLSVPIVLVACAAASTCSEFIQLWLPDRSSSKTDIIAQAIGTVMGMGLWLTTGRAITAWLHSFAASKRPQDQIDRLLEIYFVGLLVYSVMPMDLTLSPADLFHKYRRGEIAFIPFTDVRMEIGSLYGLVRDTALYIPIGMLTATWLTSSKRPVRSLVTSTLLGGLIALGIEFAQLLVVSRIASATQVVTGTLGSGAGAWLIGRWRGGHAVHDASARRTWLWLGLAAVYALLLVVVFCAPFAPILDDPEQIRQRFLGFFRLPLALLYATHPYTAISQIFRKITYFVPLGILLALAIAPLEVPRPIRRILLAGSLLLAAGLGASIEMLQVVLPEHTPDSTDVALYTIGAAIGMFIAVRIIDARRAAGSEQGDAASR